MILTRPHVLCLILALISFATSAPSPFKPHGSSDLRTSSLIQIDDDEEREVLPNLVEMDDDGEDDPPEDEEGSV